METPLKRLASLLPLFLFVPIFALGQGSTAFGNPVVTNGIGQPIAGATVAICTANPGTAPVSLCTSTLATTYTDVAIGTPCSGTNKALNNQAAPSVGSGCSNPGLTDGLGNVIVFSTSATYWCEYSGRGIVGIAVQLCVVPNSGGSGPAGAVLVVPTLAQDQSVKQPSAGGLSTPGTSLNANTFEQVRYADQFQWSQSPAGTIAIGANTVTISQTRGISTYSCVSPGTGCAGNFGGIGTTHYIRIAGTGTPEVVKITGTTCTNASTGTCTVTFTAANSHAIGYTLGTATAGFQEALVDSYSLATANPTTGREISCSPWPTSAHFIIYATIFVDGQASTFPGGTYFEGHGCVLEDAVSGGPMLKATGNSYVTFEHFTLATFAGIGRAANGTQVFIYDIGQLFHFAYNKFSCPSSGCSTDVVDRVIEVNADQGATIDHNDFEGIPMKCDATWCGAIVYGDAVSNAAIGDVHDNYFSDNQDPLLWDSGNGLTIKDNVFQNWVHYPWKYRGGLLSMTNQGGNYYEGNCNLVNPDFGMTGFSCNTGPQVETSGTRTAYQPGQERNGAGNPHRFSSTGANVYYYYIVGHTGTNFTRPLYIGDSASDGVTPVVLYWLKFGATTYDLLRSGPQANDGTTTAPYDTGNWAVTTGVVCAANPCTFTDTFAALSAYTVAQFSSNTFTPNIDYWPVPLYLHGSSGSPSVYVGPADTFVSGSTVFSTPYDAIFTSDVGGTENPTGMRVLDLFPVSEGGTSNTVGAMILNPDTGNVSAFSGHKGRINMPSFSVYLNQAQFYHNNMVYQTYDPDSTKTLATPGHQPILNAAGTDCGVGYDVDATYLAFGCGNPISVYVGHIFDGGTSAIAQFATTGLNFKSNKNPCWSNATANFTTLDGCLFRVDKNILGVNTGSGTSANGYLSTTALKQITVANATTTSVANPPTNAIFTYTLPATTTARNYTFSCTILYQSSVNTAGLILGVNSSVAPTSMLHHARIFSTKTGTATDDTITSTTSGNILTLAGANAAAGTTSYQADFYVTIEEPATGGTLTINDAATGAATITILRGSSCGPSGVN